MGLKSDATAPSRSYRACLVLVDLLGLQAVYVYLVIGPLKEE